MARGSIRLKRPPDYWELRAFAGRDPVTGRRRYVSRAFRGGKRDATKALAQLVAEVDRQGATTSTTVSAMLEAHIDHLDTRGRQALTIQGYRSIARRIAADPIGDRKVAKVGVKDLDDLYVRLTRSGLSPASVQRYHALLGAAFRQATAWGWTSTNPVRLATPPSVPRLPRRIPSPDVVAALLRGAEASRNPENHVALRLLAATGARRGEVCGLRWRSVDLDRARLSIREAVARLSTGELIIKGPKSHQIRDVVVDAGTVDLLRAHRWHQEAFAAEVGVEIASDAFVLADLVVDSTGATPVRPDRLTQAFARLAGRVPGAESMRLHDLRHWYAGTQIDAGEPLPAVAARIGDHVETLAKVYAHKGQRGDEDAAAGIGGLLDAK